MLLTYQDSVERLIDYLGGQPSDAVLRDAKMACIEALRELMQSYTWTYLYAHGRINTNASFTDGLVTYTAAGTPPFQVTLTGSTWPTWANQGIIQICNVNYDVASVVSGTILTLTPPQVPLADITTPSAYGLYQATYPLPSDFASQDLTFLPQQSAWGKLTYVHPREWLQEGTLWSRLGTPCLYTIMADTQLAGQMALRLAPFPTEAQPIEFLYKRRSNPLLVFKESAGSVATISASLAVAGTGSAFTQQMVGSCVLRLSGNNLPPTAAFGSNPAVFESKITSVTDPLTLTVYNPIPLTLTNAPYTISSYIDIETGAMTTAFLRCCEMQISMSRVMKDKPSARLQYKEALDVARCADSRVMGPRVAGVGGSYGRRLKDYPIILDREF